MVVTNAKKVKVSGRKEEQMLYRKHTMYPGGLKEIKYKEMMKRKPDEVRSTMPYDSQVTRFIASRIPFTDHSQGGIWNVAQKQVTGEKIRKTPYFP